MANALVAVFYTLLILNTIVDAGKNGSTPYLRTIIEGRCRYYLEFTQTSPKMKLRDCDTIWNAFYNSFAFKNPCKLTFADYEPFFAAVKGGNIVADKSLFWSGTYDAVHFYSYFNLRFTTLEDTFEGSMMDGLSWCGNPSLSRNTSDGIDYQSCPNCDITSAFWGQASKRFAERVRGVIHVMVNGTRARHAYSRSSFFGKYELPNLRVSNISKLIIIVAHTIGRKPIETCGTLSVKQLELDVKARGLEVDCIDDPDDVRHVLCVDNARDEHCLFLVGHNDSGHWKTIYVLIVVLSVLLIAVIVYCSCKNHDQVDLQVQVISPTGKDNQRLPMVDSRIYDKTLY